MSMLIQAILAISLFLAAAVPALAQSSRLLTGELVTLDGSSDRFRLVGHGGTYKAPGGMSVAGLDGKAVEVEIGRDGRVIQITPMQIAIEPVIHGIEMVSGQMVVGDAVTRTFTLAGDPRVYIAPMSMDIRPLGGRRVEVRLDASGQVRDVRLAAAALDAPAPVSTCVHEGRDYSDGGILCQAGTQQRCENGVWRSLDVPCAVTAAGGDERTTRSCLLGGATLAHDSHICRDGQTMRCTDGTWVDTGKPCS